MRKYVLSYSAILIVLVICDVIWLGTVAQPLYQQGIGHLMAAKPNLYFAVLFYLVYVFGLMKLVVLPNELSVTRTSTFLMSAFFGFIIYASYDLTNLAVLRDWPIKLSIIDIAWGTFITGVCGTIGKLVLDSLNNR